MNKSINIFTGFVVGSAIGAAAGILMAPAAGTETRRKIKEGALEVQDKAVTAMEDTRELVAETMEGIQGKARHLVANTGREAKYRASRLRNIGRQVVQEQVVSLEHGVDKAKAVLKS